MASPPRPPPPRPLARRLGWFALLWLGGVAAVFALAMLVRLVIG